jgi:hypothetical protein
VSVKIWVGLVCTYLTPLSLATFPAVEGTFLSKGAILEYMICDEKMKVERDKDERHGILDLGRLYRAQ